MELPRANSSGATAMQKKAEAMAQAARNSHENSRLNSMITPPTMVSKNGLPAFPDCNMNAFRMYMASEAKERPHANELTQNYGSQKGVH